MTTTQGPDQGTTWEAEQDYLRGVQLGRQREDEQAHHEFSLRYEQTRSRLIELYDRKSALQNDLQSIEQSIKLQEMEQERLAKDWEDTVSRVTSERRDQDRQREAWFSKHRENGSPRRTNGRRASSRDMGNPQSNAGGWTSINGIRSRTNGTHDDDEELPTDPGNLLSSGYQPADGGEPNGKPVPFRSNGADMDVDDGEAALAVRSRPLKPKQRHSLPGFASEPGRVKQDTPIESKARSPSGRRSLPGARSQSQQVEPAPPVDLAEINRDTVILKHNGTIYTEPAMYYGVPVGKIKQGDGYWDPEWIPLREHILPQLETWQKKLDALRQDKSAVRHTVFLANRQVNRGQAIIDFLNNAEAEFHPYQYVGKEMMQKFYKTFINYDTMFRLVNVHEELKKFDLDVPPLDWLRQRMYEVSLEQGEKFNLSKYTHDLYHDRKLKVLREKHGFGNIGRPSGYKVGEKNPDKGKAKLKRESMGLGGRRKARRSIGQVDMGDSPTSLDGFSQPPPEYLEPVTPRLQKKQRLEAAPMQAPVLPQIKHEPEIDELEFDGWTSTDSFSAGRIMHLDWRVYQIKTSQLTTSTEVTQYWTWRKETSTFEHQVLRDVHPKVTWGYYQKPINFDLKLDDIIEVRWSHDSQKILVLIKELPARGGTVLAYFKRERTKKRFLSFIRKRDVRLIKAPPEQIEDVWNTMKSDTLPGEEE
ncbi:hypothetical protein BX600DRAFT_84939 [Xylariales sp. PMI_506]|nr:hypothetical protein BX600DRAFT_84939 [Xylariales sp. PMI_506]